MKELLKSIVHQLKNYSSTLHKTNILVDKPWALIDEEYELQKLIFKQNKELILSKNGQVQIGRWDYFPEAKSLLIDRNTDIILCNEAFIDNGVMILKLDGTENRYFMLANENVVPDLNVKEYLKSLRFQKLHIVEKKLFDGRFIEVHRNSEQFDDISIGNHITIDSETIEDGKYQLIDDENYLIEVDKGKIHKILIETTHINPENQEIIIQQQHGWEVTNGDYVFINGVQIENAIINFSKNKNLIVRDWKVVRLERKNPITRAISNFFKKILMIYAD